MNDLKKTNKRFSLFIDDTILQAKKKNLKLLVGKEDLPDLISKFNNVAEHNNNYLTIHQQSKFGECNLKNNIQRHKILGIIFYESYSKS